MEEHRNQQATQQEVKSMSLEAQVIRADGTVEDLGVVAYYHIDPEIMKHAMDQGLGRITLGENNASSSTS